LEAHNLFLAALYNFGIIGLTLLVSMFVALAVGLIGGMRRSTGDHRTLFVMTCATFLGVLVQQVEGADLFDQAIGVDFFVVMALPFARCWSESGTPATPPGASPAATPGGRQSRTSGISGPGGGPE
jgi:O-antigen ligase